VFIQRTCWGTHCEFGEHFENPLGNMENGKKNLPSPPPPPKNKKKNLPPPPPPTNSKEIKARHLGLSYWLKGK